MDFVDKGRVSEPEFVEVAGVKDTLTVPAPAGTVAVIEVAEFTVTEVAATPPNCTFVAPVRPIPVMVTVAPAAAVDGDTEVICGQVPWTPLAAQVKVGYEPFVIVQTELDQAGEAPVNVDAVFIAEVV